MNKKLLIEYFKQGGKIRVLNPSHKFYNMDRNAEKVQTNAVKFKGGSWLYFNELKTEFIYNQGFKISDFENDFIEYAFMDMDLIDKLMKGGFKIK